MDDNMLTVMTIACHKMSFAVIISELNYIGCFKFEASKNMLKANYYVQRNSIRSQNSTIYLNNCKHSPASFDPLIFPAQQVE